MRKMNRIVSLALVGVITMSIFGLGTASAASGHSTPGGGVWNWSTIPGVHATSSYYHSTKMHSASAQVGTGKVVRSTESAGGTAIAKATGVGTCYVNWNVY